VLNKGVQTGVLLFGLFFGAGNLIFPPSLGWEAANNYWPAIIGFVITGVGMPVLALLVGLFNLEGYRAEINQKIGKLFSLLFLCVVYLSIGPFMAIPRTAAMSFQVGIAPLTGTGSLELLLYSSVYFFLCRYLCITPTKILDRVGKFLTPVFAVMIVLLFLLGLENFTEVFNEVPAGSYATVPLGKGCIEGYNTLDMLAAFVFCTIGAATLRQLGFRSRREYLFCVWVAALAVTALMAFLYGGLALLGNHFPITNDAFADPDFNIGAHVLTMTAQHVFGTGAKYFLAVMISVTCFTTAVGLVACCSDFFSKEFPRFSYRGWVNIFTLLSLLIANLGLNQIIKVCIPVLLVEYPICIAIVVLIIVNKWLALSRFGMRLAIAVTAIIALGDSLAQFVPRMQWLDVFLSVLPLHASGQGWLTPFVIILFLCLVLPDKIYGAKK